MLTDSHQSIRISMVHRSPWLGGFALPVILNPPLPQEPQAARAENILRILQAAVAHRAPSSTGPHTVLPRRLAVFRDSLAGVHLQGSPGQTAFGFSASDVMLFAIAANIVAGLATVAFGWVDGKDRTEGVILSLSAVAGFGVFFRPPTGPSSSGPSA